MAESSNKRFFAKHAKSSALLVSLIVHVVLVVVGLSIVVVTVVEKKDQAFVVQEAKRPQMKLRKLRVPVNVRKKKISKPVMQKTVAFKTEVKTVDIKLSYSTDVTGGWEFLDTAGGLDGLDLGLDVNFFGIMGGGSHIVFIIDYSLSMWGQKERIMRREASRVIHELPDGTRFSVIFFGGPAWPAGIDPKLNNWVKTGDDWQSFRPKDWNALPKVIYKKANAITKLNEISKIKSTPLIYGTVYDCPIYMALRMDPIPDTIFFMTDGESDPERGIMSLQRMVDKLTAAGKKVPVMHMVGFGVTHNDQLREMAALTGGECRFLTTWDYIKKYGEDRSKRVKLKSGFDVEKGIESVSADQYPVEFPL